MTSANKNTLSSAAVRFVAPAAILSAFLFTSGNASAASLQNNVSGWQQGTEPSNMSMSLYVPDNVAENAPILVVLHYCGGNAGNVFSQSQGGGIVSSADQNGFILLIPQTSRNCWDVATTAAMTNGGGSDTLSIVHMVEYVVSQYTANADRVYAVGTSGGAMGAQGLVAVYPDVFKGGSGFSGVPAGCWGVGNMTDGQWSSQCANGQVTHTEQEWGDQVRAMYPGYTGFRPRVQIYHGDADSTINFANHTEAVKEWRNVLGLGAEPDATSNVNIGGTNFEREEWKDSCGNTVLDVLTEPGGPHNTSANMNGQLVIPFFNLDSDAATDPQADCYMPGGNTGGGGAGTGGNGVGGEVSGGGADAGAAGAPSGGTGVGGSAPMGGTTAMGGATVTGTTVMAGSTATGGTVTGTGGAAPTGVATGVATGNTVTGATGTAGAAPTGVTATGVTTGMPTGAAAGAASTGSAGPVAVTGTTTGASGGCSVGAAGQSSRQAVLPILLAAGLVLAGRRTRRRR